MALKALFLNCTLKQSPAVSNTQALIDKVVGLMERQGVATRTVRIKEIRVTGAATAGATRESSFANIRTISSVDTRSISRVRAFMASV